MEGIHKRRGPPRPFDESSRRGLAPRSLGAGFSWEQETMSDPFLDLLKPLLSHLQGATDEPDEAISAARACASDIRRVAAGASQAEDARGALSLLADLLTDLAALVESSERKFARLGFDLHDGAIQDVAALAYDVRFFRKQLGFLSGHEHYERVLGLVDDLEARLHVLDKDLRELVQAFESPSLLKRPFGEALRKVADAFTADTGIKAAVDLKGSLGFLSPSQRIALLRVVQGALANVRQHSDATEVLIEVSGEAGRVEAFVRDNGRGFEVESTLMRAVKMGALGLVGMSERVRLLGGSFDVQSRRGGPTTVSVKLTEWRPAPADASPAKRSYKARG